MPSKPTFRSVPTNLIPCAEEAHKYFKGKGYKISVNKYELKYPSMPTLCCCRGGTELFVEVCMKIKKSAVEQWVAFGKSCSGDTRFAVCVPNTVILKADTENMLRQFGVGLYHEQLGGGVLSKIAAKDLSLNVQLPPLNSLPLRIRALMGPAYEQFDNSEPIQGFRIACQVIEDKARKDLMDGVRSGRITFVTKSGKGYKMTSIKRMTVGQLIGAYSKIQNQNQKDSTYQKALTSILDDRNDAVHHSNKPKISKRLRATVGQHMWTIVSALKLVSA